jgi:succinate dehydrogenase / fumarate reductase iron-sulfur subunit
MVARAIYTEIRQGRGCGPAGDHVLLDLTHLPPEVIDAKLPDITEFARTYLGVEPYDEGIPIQPTAHYAMGGVPTNIDAQVLRDNVNPVPGLFAAGEVACVSVHGANRLGTNSLLDINVFGRRGGLSAAAYANSVDFVEMPPSPEAPTLALLQRLKDGGGTELVARIRDELQDTMDANASVYRTEATLKQAEVDLASLKERYLRVGVADRGARYNTELLEAVELGFLLDLAECLVVSAKARNESRGGHFREDYPTRDDVNFMRHTMAYKVPDETGLTHFRPTSGWTTSRSCRPATSRWSASTDDDDREHPQGDVRRRPERSAERKDSEKVTGEIRSFEVTLKIRRYNPELDSEPHWENYTVTAYGTDRLIDALHRIKWDIDGSLTFRRSCGHGICGSDAMRINGRNRLACKTLLKDLNPSKPITVEPIKGLPVEKDLIVDMEPFFAAYREVMPFLITTGAEPTRERVQTQEERLRYDDTTKCIMCAACTSSCPVFWTDGQYFGPQAIVGAHRFIFDSRDAGSDLRLEILNSKEGVWRCRTTFNCTEACPRGIEVTKAIQEVKRALIARAI